MVVETEKADALQPAKKMVSDGNKEPICCPLIVCR